MSSGAPPLANGSEAPLARNRSGGAPSSFKQFYAIKNSLQFHKRLRNAKTTWAREKPPSDHWSRAMSSSVSR